MGTKDNLYVNAADICLSTECWPSVYDRVEIHVEVNRPVRTINLDEYTKKVQDDMMEALRETINIIRPDVRQKILGEGRKYITQTIIESSGHEFMERYEKWKSDEENKLKQEQIEAAKKLLRENGFKVTDHEFMERFMERYEKWKSDEENKLKQEQIEAAKKLLRENGFKVTEV